MSADWLLFVVLIVIAVTAALGVMVTAYEDKHDKDRHPERWET